MCNDDDKVNPNSEENNEEKNQLSEEELEQLILSAKEKMKQQKKKRFIKLELSLLDYYVRNKYLNFFIIMCINIILGMVITGYIGLIKYNNLIYFITAFVMYSLLEYISKTVLIKYYFQFILMTLGVIFIFINFFIFLIVDILLMDNFHFETIGKMILFSLLFSISRKIIYKFYKTAM